VDLSLAAIEPNAFHIIGGLFAAWAILLGFMGLRRPDFPANIGGQRLVIAVSLTLMVGAVSAAIITGETKKHEGGHGAEGHAPGAAPEPHK
jgi:hypothetical protein